MKMAVFLIGLIFAASTVALARGKKELPPPPSFNLALILTEKRHYKSAIEEYQRVLEINPNDAAAHFNLALLYDEQMKDSTQALDHYRAYLQLEPDAEDRQKVKKWIIDNLVTQRVRDRSGLKGALY